MNKFFLMTVFCLISNTACPMDDRKPDLSSHEPIPLDLKNKDALLEFIKQEFVRQEEFPASANLSLAEFVLDKDQIHPQLGQRYIVKVVATWTSYRIAHSEPGCHVLIPKKHGVDLYSHMFKSGLDHAGVKLPERK